MLPSGASAEVRGAMGITVFSGMLGVTIIGLVLTPVFYVGLRTWALTREARRRVGVTELVVSGEEIAPASLALICRIPRGKHPCRTALKLTC